MYSVCIYACICRCVHIAHIKPIQTYSLCTIELFYSQLIRLKHPLYSRFFPRFPFVDCIRVE